MRRLQYGAGPQARSLGLRDCCLSLWSGSAVCDMAPSPRDEAARGEIVQRAGSMGAIVGDVGAFAVAARIHESIVRERTRAYVQSRAQSRSLPDAKV